MTVQVYCDQDAIESIFSSHGVLYAIDDDRSGEAETSNDDGKVEPQYIADCIERATVRINQYVQKLYDLTTLPSNVWTKWCCATLSARCLCRRRGEGAPDGLVADADEYIEFLKQVKDHEAVIPKNGNNTPDAQLLVSNAGMTMSNLRVNQQYPFAKIRAVTHLSSGKQQSALLRHPDYRAFRFVME